MTVGDRVKRAGIDGSSYDFSGHTLSISILAKQHCDNISPSGLKGKPIDSQPQGHQRRGRAALTRLERSSTTRRSGLARIELKLCPLALASCGLLARW